jgi:hypothetical protein|tara:strand:- start:288 stop:482 length:195 start_codon:yes stop_codon:yes gene_type:complete
MKKLDKSDIITILMLPLLGLVLIGFYLFLAIAYLGVLSFIGIQMLWEFLKEIDYGFDRDFSIKK